MKIRAKLETADVAGDLLRLLDGKRLDPHEVNGEKVGGFNGVEVGDDGDLVALYSNGQRFRVTVRALGKAKASK